MLKHQRQISDCDCGSFSYLMIINYLQPFITPLQSIKEVKCDRTGTNTYDVLNAFKSRNIEATLVNLEIDYKDYFHILETLSKDNIIYLAGEFRNKSKTRDRVRQHAFCAFQNLIFDPAENHPIPIDSYFHTFTKRLFLNQAIFIPKPS